MKYHSKTGRSAGITAIHTDQNVAKREKHDVNRRHFCLAKAASIARSYFISIYSLCLNYFYVSNPKFGVAPRGAGAGIQNSAFIAFFLQTHRIYAGLTKFNRRRPAVSELCDFENVDTARTTNK